MNWITNIIRPRIRSLVEPKEVPDNLWKKCPSCEGMLFHRDLEKSLNVCYHCNHHLRITVKERLAIIFDEGHYETISIPNVPNDPLKFKDRKKYSDRLRENKNKTGLKDAITLAKGKIGGQKAVIAAFNFSFMGGSMGAAVGEGLVRAAEEAVKSKSAFITIPASGGARMQEGMLSLMQMPRSIIAVEMVKDAKLPYLVLLTDPTTGGVSASFAMVGDIHLAEPGSTIGFAGRRVIEETVRETLPDDFQTAEYLKEHGIVDIVVSREELAKTLGTILNLLMNKTNNNPNKDIKKKIKTSKNNGKNKPKSTNTKYKSKSNYIAKARKQVKAAQIAANKTRKKQALKPALKQVKKTAKIVKA
ncbi:MAG: acetyl-CoA carboxylase carboxyltransferase subunit beta [Alphaproteobacteria bacterium]|nr:acetyl-CoA carboxylase carboxyltransferase subunit beta [Alphaproteobacteria bacterium]